MAFADIISNIQEARSRHLENQAQKRDNTRQGLENARNRYSLMKDILQDVSNGLSNVKSRKKIKKKTNFLPIFIIIISAIVICLYLFSKKR